MTYYAYYQDSQPNWGTQQYQTVLPPAPQYQPQPSWRGVDYYRAHSGIRDNTIFDYVMYKLRDIVGARGVSRRKARHWWDKIYTGLVTPAQMLPKEIGAAAGYEALRCWETYRSIYAQPLSADAKREREALIGIAAAEATKLWEYTGRVRDRYGRLEASEVAAATASRLLLQSYERGAIGGGYASGSLSRRRSLSAGRYHTLGDTSYDEDDDVINGYGLDDGYSTRTGRRRSLTPNYGVRPMSSMTFGDGIRRSSPVAYGAGISRSPSLYADGLRRHGSPIPYAYGNNLPDPGPYAYGMGSGLRTPSPLPIGTMGSPMNSSYVDESIILNSPNVTYDPVLGPGIPGTYYPNVARAQVTAGGGGGRAVYPGTEYGGVGAMSSGGGQYINPPTLGQMGRRRSHSFNSYYGKY